ncbi:hypothetical protein OHZ10_33280 [Burkholderia arboris]|uniref:Uncharacterized protein n=2 Tax=Burkholderia arboris TaxID=488730 RepID=A0A9Q9UQC0_9BURK|nr:hypothetical protein [Burkholderia arboris]MCA8489301.1 hypothetical protein [Burkholderia arboris]VWB50887.1 hypothetical protein BAR24066_02317 [Burkholderia arboris]
MNDITSGCLSSLFGCSSTQSPQGMSNGGNMGGIGLLRKLKQDIEKLITDMLGMNGGADGNTGGVDDSMGGNYGNGMPQRDGAMNGNNFQTGGDYGSEVPGDDFGQSQGQGLRDVKFNSPAGGEALHLKMDQNGNLFNGSGNSVGRYDPQTRQLSFNSGAGKEIERLMTGGRNMLGVPDEFAPKKGPGGNAVFSPSQFTMSVGDLNQKADF